MTVVVHVYPALATALGSPEFRLEFGENAVAWTQVESAICNRLLESTELPLCPDGHLSYPIVALVNNKVVSKTNATLWDGDAVQLLYALAGG